jgi:hypothetical protein
VFERLALIGLGLIGSSESPAAARHLNLARTIVAVDQVMKGVLDRVRELGLGRPRHRGRTPARASAEPTSSSSCRPKSGLRRP